jgi:ADP-L-glycero-D-manno-heptose 6-epimerase
LIAVTGGAGFIGSNLVHGLNRAGREDLVVVDNLTDSSKVRNLAGARIADYVDKDDFRAALRESAAWLAQVTAVFNQGACSSTTEKDGRYVLRNNYDYSKDLLAFCQDRRIPLIYASSAAVYGADRVFREDGAHDAPRNAYGLSKSLFDNRVRIALESSRSQIVGLRYFNVYGPREDHKGPMASMVLQLDDQLQACGKARLFDASDGYEAGEQRRDFVYVKDVVDVVLWFFDNPGRSGIFNCGTGTSRSFNELAREVIRFRGEGTIEYFPFPDALRGRYQGFTEAGLSRLRAAGYAPAFTSIERGVAEYLSWRRGDDGD